MPRGVALKIITYFVGTIDNKKHLKTSKINISSLADALCENINSTRQALKRLKRKKVIKTVEFSKNRYEGYAVFKLSSSFYKKFLKNHPTNSSLNKTTTIKKIEIHTEKESPKNELPDEWQKINTSSLEEIGLTKAKLFDIYESGNIAADAVQESINHFAWGLKNNSTKYEGYTNHLAVFIGRLRKGKLWTESGYETPQELALKEMLSIKRKQKAKQEKLLDELTEVEFPEWEKKLSKEKKIEIAPINMFSDKEVIKRMLRAHFKKQVLLPRLKQEKLL